MGNKRIAYIAVDNGVDGREKSTITYAAWSEEGRGQIRARDANKAFKTNKEIIVDVDAAKRKAYAKLDGVDRLVLGLSDKLMDKLQ